MTLKLKINPYDTLFIVKFQIFFLSKTRLFVSYQSFDIGFQTQMKTNWFKSLKRTTIQDSYLTQESCDQMTNDSPLVYQGQCTDENKDKHLIKKCYFFHLLQQKKHFFFKLRITTVITNRWALTLQSRASFYKHTAKSSQPPGHSQVPLGICQGDHSFLNAHMLN